MVVLFFTVDSVEGPGMEKERVSKKGGGGRVSCCCIDKKCPAVLGAWREKLGQDATGPHAAISHRQNIV